MNATATHYTIGAMVRMEPETNFVLVEHSPNGATVEFVTAEGHPLQLSMLFPTPNLRMGFERNAKNCEEPEDLAATILEYLGTNVDEMEERGILVLPCESHEIPPRATEEPAKTITAPNAYARAMNKCLELQRGIQSMLNEIPLESAAYANWGHVGDLNRVAQDLQAAFDMLKEATPPKEPAPKGVKVPGSWAFAFNSNGERIRVFIPE